jgi:hypothetical protein
MVPVAVTAAAVIPATVVSATVVTAAIVSASVISVVVPPPPIWTIAISRTIPVSVVVRSGTVIRRSVKNRHRDRQTEGEMDTGAGGRFSDERQSRDNHQQNDKLLHSNNIGRKWVEFDQIDSIGEHPGQALRLLQKKKQSA